MQHMQYDHHLLCSTRNLSWYDVVLSKDQCDFGLVPVSVSSMLRFFKVTNMNGGVYYFGVRLCLIISKMSSASSASGSSSR
jgi:hypothetical protein